MAYDGLPLLTAVVPYLSTTPAPDGNNEPIFQRYQVTVMKRSWDAHKVHEMLDPLAQALLSLGGNWRPQEEEDVVVHPTQTQSGRAPKAPRISDCHARRGYVWRGPHREELKKQQHRQWGDAAGTEGKPSRSRKSAATQGLPSDDVELTQQQCQQYEYQQQQHQQEQEQEPSRQPKDSNKEWAALTTWLRMNLHHPRTAKRVVLFVGQQDPASGSWSFSLNTEVSWEEVSLETKLRLKTLPVEAEQAFVHKYPDRHRHEWSSKVQKYKPPGSSSTVQVCLGDVVRSLNNIYHQHEGCCSQDSSHPPEQQEDPPPHQQ